MAEGAKACAMAGMGHALISLGFLWKTEGWRKWDHRQGGILRNTSHRKDSSAPLLETSWLVQIPPEDRIRTNQQVSVGNL